VRAQFQKNSGGCGKCKLKNTEAAGSFPEWPMQTTRSVWFKACFLGSK